jgi:hypothetical protein
MMKKRLPNTMYDAGPMTLCVFLANNLEHHVVLGLTNKNHSERFPLCSKVMCDYKVFACHPTTHTCLDLASCKPLVWMQLCGHVIGAKSLVQHIRAGKNNCPMCSCCVWFRLTVEYVREGLLNDSRLWNWCWGWDLGQDQD